MEQRKYVKVRSTPSSHVFFNIHGLISSSHDPFTINELQNHSIVFISETWLHSTQTPLLPSKSVITVPAIKPPGRGRPSGGLHLYYNPKFNSRLNSSDQNHISVSFDHISIIGVYFKPNSDIDDIIISLATALRNIPASSPIVIGGDFNVHPNTTEFFEICDFLFHQGISLISRTDQPTFSYSKGSSCVDYIFSSRCLPVKSVKTIPINSSDHIPIQAVLRVRRKASLPSRVILPKRIDIDAAVKDLTQLQIDDVPAHELCSKIDQILNQATRTMTIRKEPKKPWFNQHSYELRKYCQNLFHLSKRDSKYLAEYSIARKAYQSHLRYAKKSYEESKNQNLIDKTLRNGIHELYKQGRKKTENNSISLNDLFKYSKDLYKNVNNEAFKLLPSCEDQRHILLQPFTINEVESCLSKMKSKALSSTGSISPHFLQTHFTIHCTSHSNCFQSLPQKFIISSIMARIILVLHP